MRKVVVLLATSAVCLLVSAGSALAQQIDEYPPAPPGPGEAVVTPGAPGAGAAPELAITGSNTMFLVWLALAALIIGTVLVVAARRRRAIRSRGLSSAIA